MQKLKNFSLISLELGLLGQIKNHNDMGCEYHCRLQQTVQNPISDNTNVLWNSQFLGKNYSYRLPLVL